MGSDRTPLTAVRGAGSRRAHGRGGVRDVHRVGVDDGLPHLNDIEAGATVFGDDEPVANVRTFDEVLARKERRAGVPSGSS